MSTWAIAICTGLHLVAACDLFNKGQAGLGLTFASYALANVGLIWAAMSKV